MVKTNMRSLFSLFTLATYLLVACKNDPSKGQTAATDALSNIPGARYVRLEGTVGSEPVVLHLTSDNTVGAPTTNYGGQVVWADGSTSMVFGTPDSSGHVVLEVSFNGQDSSLRYRLDKITPGGAWTGTQEAPKVPVTFTERYPVGTLRFAIKEWQDSMKSDPKIKDSPVCEVSQSVMVPNAAEPALNDWLLQAFLKAYGNDSLPDRPNNFDALFQASRKEAFDQYVEAIKEYEPEKNGDLPEFFSYSFATSMEILHNGNNRLTIGVSYYTYTGGAHGMYGTSLYSYDLQTKKRLGLEDVLKPGAKNQLQPHLNTAARRWAGMGAHEPLDNVFFVENNTVPLTENVGIVEKGLIFNYLPYEIGAYALGEVRLFVPFSEIKALMK